MRRLPLLRAGLSALALAGLVWLLPWSRKTQPLTAETTNTISDTRQVPTLAATELPRSSDKREHLSAGEARVQPPLPTTQPDPIEGWGEGDAYWEDHSDEEEARRAEAVPVEPESVWSHAGTEEAHEP